MLHSLSRRRVSLQSHLSLCSTSLACTALLLAGASSTASGQAILEVYGNTLTNYRHNSATVANDVRPRFDQRGVGIDGTAREGSGLPWAFAGNPFGDPGAGGFRMGEMNLALGTYSPMEVDIALPAPGGSRWIIGRTFNGRQETNAPAHRDSDGVQGFNWFQMSQPELRFYDPAGDTSDVIYLIYGADRYLEFLRTGTSSNAFKGKNGAAGVMEYVSGSPDTWIYHDQHGNRTYFFGNNTSSSRADWQVWKHVDAAGNIAYVGDATTASTAASSGYNTGQRISTAYDGSANDGRRYSYSYTSIGGVSRVTEVKAETKASGTWASPSGVVEVARVTYDYYTADVSGEGKIGDLKLVTILTSLTDSGSTLSSGIFTTRKQYYRYYTGSWTNSDGLRGEPHQIKLVVDPEGCRNFDYSEVGGGEPTLDDGFLTASDADLKAYSSAYLEYVSAGDYRISSAFFNGECGCSGGVNGAYTFTYGTGSNYATAIGGSTYNTGANDWQRTVVGRPDGKYESLYFDEVGQSLSRVITDGDPAVSYTDMWATQVIRDSVGCVTEVRSPGANDTYTHSTGALVGLSGAGLITEYTRVPSGQGTGLLEFTTHKVGTSGTAYYDAKMEYDVASATKTAASYAWYRPLISGTRAYPVVNVIAANKDTAANFHATGMSYTMWTSDAAMMPKVITTTHPAVDSGNNGSGSSTTSKRYARKDGTTAFTEDALGIFNYTEYSGGLVVSTIQDCITNSGSNFASGDDPNTDFGITESGAGSDRETTYTHDAQGRMSTVTAPDGRVSASYYSRLADSRSVNIHFPRRTTGGSTTHFGPASYSVANQAGRPEFTGVIAITSAGSTAALTAYIDETDADPITALDTGTLARMGTTLYDEPGTKVEASRSYFDIPGSGAGSDGTNYDQVTFGYDVMGRQWRTKVADGTITRTVFDDLGRMIERHIGLNDYNFSGGESSGPDDTVMVEEVEYDAGADGGNSHLTLRTLFVEDSSTGQRQTDYEHDDRGRVIVVNNPQSPHIVNKYDNLGRLVGVGTYSSTSGLDATDDPTSLTTNRIGLSQTFFDERGQVWKSQVHKIDVTDGSDDDTLQTLNWYDPVGRLMKTDGNQLTKTRYDRLGRAVIRWTLAVDNDSQYGHASANTAVWDTTNSYTSIAGDHVLEESRTAYESVDSDNVLMTSTVSRHYDDLSTGTTGMLDTNADNDDMVITAANITGRVQIASMWYDDLDRLVDTVLYGTNAIVGDGSTSTGTFTRTALSVPSRSDVELRTTTVYNEDGTVLSVEDPKALITRWAYDDLGRKVTEIRNYVNGSPSGETGDDDNHTRFTYLDGHMSTMWVDFDGDNVVDTSAPADQVTRYIYGTTEGTPAASLVSTGHLLRAVVYPDSSNAGTDNGDINSDDSDVVSYCYNAQGQVVYTKDQAANVIENEYDTGGRITDRKATSINTGAGFDASVKRISTTYTSRSQVDTVGQYSLTSAGTCLDEVNFDYDDWGNILTFEQDVDSVIGASGRVAFSVAHTYAKNTSGRNTLRKATTTLPGSFVVTYNYSSAGNSLANDTSRVSSLSWNSATRASYEYIGLTQLAGQDLNEPNVLNRQFTGTKAYANLDRFNRVLTSDWKRSGGAAFYDLDLTYDRNSNITEAIDNVHIDHNGKHLYDALYTMDGLNRLRQASEGRVVASAIGGGDLTRDEWWEDSSGNLALSQTGNWIRHRYDFNGDGLFNAIDVSGDIDLTATTFGKSNELTAQTQSTGTGLSYTSVATSLSYSATGDWTDDGANYTYTYDVFGRMRSVQTRGGSPVAKAQYRYNGLGMRISWTYDTDNDNDIDGNDRTYYFTNDERWRQVATFRDSDANAKERFVFHAAGLDGSGRSSYIDSVAMRDRDDNSGWTSAADGTLEQRSYYCQNWRADVSAVITDSGKPREWIKYTSYGIPTSIDPADYNRDGFVSGPDFDDFTDDYLLSDARADVNFDGVVDSADDTDFNAWFGSPGSNYGRYKLSSFGNRMGYAGYQFDPTFEGAYRILYHVRHRVYDAGFGRWTRRDPAGYVDGPQLYIYLADRPISSTDPFGLRSQPGQGRPSKGADCPLTCGVWCAQLPTKPINLWQLCYGSCLTACEDNQQPGSNPTSIRDTCYGACDSLYPISTRPIQNAYCKSGCRGGLGPTIPSLPPPNDETLCWAACESELMTHEQSCQDWYEEDSRLIEDWCDDHPSQVAECSEMRRYALASRAECLLDARIIYDDCISECRESYRPRPAPPSMGIACCRVGFSHRPARREATCGS